MKKSLLIIVGVFLFLNVGANAQKDKTKRKSPPTSTKQVIASGAEITISYGQPSLKGRKIGKEVEPKEGKIWRAGADEATTFETTKDVKINGENLPAGKYSFFTYTEKGKAKEEFIIIFNKTWDQWGGYDYKEKDDALRIKVKPENGQNISEKLTYTIDASGQVSLAWGDLKIGFKVE
jgi:hypothetical protein